MKANRGKSHEQMKTDGWRHKKEWNWKNRGRTDKEVNDGLEARHRNGGTMETDAGSWRQMEAKYTGPLTTESCFVGPISIHSYHFMSWPLTLLASRPWALDGVKIRRVSSPQQTFIWLSVDKILGFFHSMTWEQVLLGKARPARDLLRLRALLWVDHATDWVQRTTISKTSLKHFLWVFCLHFGRCGYSTAFRCQWTKKWLSSLNIL